MADIAFPVGICGAGDGAASQRVSRTAAWKADVRRSPTLAR
jgi:hypothetical protein